MKYCTNCLAQNKDEARFCKECGADLSIQSGVQSILKGKYLIGKAAEEAYEYTAYNGLNLADKSRVVICESTRRIRGDEEERTAAARFAKELESLQAGGKLKNLIQAEAFCEDGEAYVILQEKPQAQTEVKTKPEDRPADTVKPKTEDKPSGTIKPKPEEKPDRKVKPEDRRQPADTVKPAPAGITADPGLNHPVMAAAIAAAAGVLLWLTGTHVYAYYSRRTMVFFGYVVFPPLAAIVLFCLAVILVRKKRFLNAGMVMLVPAALTFWWYFTFREGAYHEMYTLVIVTAISAVSVAVPAVLLSASEKKSREKGTEGLNHQIMAISLFVVPCFMLFLLLGSISEERLYWAFGRDTAGILSIIFAFAAGIGSFVLAIILHRRKAFRAMGVLLLLVHAAACFCTVLWIGEYGGAAGFPALLTIILAAAGIYLVIRKTGKN